MKIEHIAIWVSELDLIKDFYQKYFGATSNNKYHNTKTGFTSYFLSFEGSARIEIMCRPDIEENNTSKNQFGYAHIAMSVGTKENVVALTELIRKDGYEVYSEPRTTGDGYFESVIKDPDGNLIEITV